MADVVQTASEFKLCFLKFNELTLEVQEIKIESGKVIDEVRFWTQTLETKLCKFENINKDSKRVAGDIQRKEEEKTDEEKRKRVLKGDIELEKAKLEVRSKYEASSKPSSAGEMGAKLPRLFISKFQSNHVLQIQLDCGINLRLKLASPT